MANQDKMWAKANREAQKIVGNIQSNMDKLYSSIYSTSPQTTKDYKAVTSGIGDKIDKIIDGNQATVGMPSVSKLYSRINLSKSSTPDANVTDNITKMFEDSALMDDLYASFMDNRYLIEQDVEYDTICKYMPKLEEALLVKKDNVLSADYFSKDFLNMTNPKDMGNETFEQRIADLKEKYDLIELADSSYYKASKYGERYIYLVPFKTAIAKLLQYKPLTTMSGIHEGNIETPYNENYTMTITAKGFNLTSKDRTKTIITSEATVIREVTKSNSHGNDVKVINESQSLLSDNEGFSIDVEVCTSGLLEDAIIDKLKADKKRAQASVSSISEAFKNCTSKVDSIISEAIKSINEESDLTSGTLSFGTEYGKGLKTQSNKTNGVIGSSGFTSIENEKPVNLNITGSVLKTLKRHQVIPIYIDDMCLGYYVIEIKGNAAEDTFMGFHNVIEDPLSAGQSRDVRTNFDSINAEKQDETIRYVAGQLSQFIDKKFINANQDISKEIYMILKYNEIFNTPYIDKIKITFVPPEDIIHIYFNMDEDTHRGISDLSKCVVPAKIFSSLYVTNTLLYLTRGADKRVYYVKQNVDQNIAQNLLNVIQQIKQGNFGLRQFSSINTMLNQTGRFNDYVIPTTASGDYPIQFEIMPGQDVDVMTDFMNMLEEMAINAIDVPYEIIQSRQSVDYATQLSMSNTKFLRIIYKRQSLYQKFLSEIVTRLYNYEYDAHTRLECKLPAPNFLNSTNMSQIVENAKQYAQTLIEFELDPNEDEEVKAEYTKLLIHDVLGSHVDINKHKEMLTRARITVKTSKLKSEDDM